MLTAKAPTARPESADSVRADDLRPPLDASARPAAPSDLDRICALEQACSRNPWTRGGIADSLLNKDSIFLAAENRENLIIGFACSSLVLDELHIQEIAVDPDYRNKGVGALLINRTIQAAAGKNAKRAYLEVRSSNRPAIRLYEKCGFAADTVRAKYYGDGEDAVFMSRGI